MVRVVSRSEEKETLRYGVVFKKEFYPRWPSELSEKMELAASILKNIRPTT